MQISVSMCGLFLRLHVTKAEYCAYNEQNLLGLCHVEGYEASPASYSMNRVDILI